MNKTVIAYWSGTGHTHAMADAIAKGLRDAGADVDEFSVSDITAAAVAAYDNILLGCPSMSSELLEEWEFEPFFLELRPLLSGKKVGLFGSFGWGDGEWMRNWQDHILFAGATLFEDGLVLNEAPDAAGIKICEAFGQRFAKI